MTISPTPIPTNSQRLDRGTEVLLYRKVFLAESATIPAYNNRQRTVVKFRCPENKSGWKRVTIPTAFIRSPELDKKTNSTSLTVGELKKILENLDDSLPICVAHSPNNNPSFAPKAIAATLDDRVPLSGIIFGGTLDKKDPKDTTIPTLVIYS